MIPGGTWKEASLFANEVITSDFQFKIRVVISREDASETSPRWGATRFRYKNSASEIPKVIKEEGATDRIAFNHNGLYLDSRPPLWMGPDPNIAEGDLIYFGTHDRLNVIANPDVLTIGNSDKRIMQNFDSADLPTGDPLQKVRW